MERKINEDIFKIKPRQAPPFRVTKEHPILVAKKVRENKKVKEPSPP